MKSGDGADGVLRRRPSRCAAPWTSNAALWWQQSAAISRSPASWEPCWVTRAPRRQSSPFAWNSSRRRRKRSGSAKMIPWHFRSGADEWEGGDDD